MKIVFLAPFGIRPKGTVIARMLPLAVELQKQGHIVTIIAPPYTNPEDSGKTENLRGVRLVNVALPNVGKALSALPLVWRMFRAALEERADVIHLFKPKGYGGLAAMLLLVLRRYGMRLPPLLVDTDDWEGRGGMNELHAYSTLEKRLFAFQEQWLSRHAAGITVASRELERLTKNLGVAAERILYLPNGVDETGLSRCTDVREKLGIAPATPVVLLYTRFFEFSQERLYRMFTEIYRCVPGVCFLVVGKGRHNEEQDLLSASRSLGFESALCMAGWIEPDRIPDYLATADVAVYPLDDTLFNRAKCPAKLTELLAAGIAVVADRVGQAVEYIDPERSGILCNPDNWREMAEAVVRALRDPELKSTLGENGRVYLLKQFSWTIQSQQLTEFIGSKVHATERS